MPNSIALQPRCDALYEERRMAVLAMLKVAFEKRQPVIRSLDRILPSHRIKVEVHREYFTEAAVQVLLDQMATKIMLMELPASTIEVFEDTSREHPSFTFWIQEKTIAFDSFERYIEPRLPVNYPR